METNFFHYNFEPSHESTDEMVEILSASFEEAGIKIQSVEMNYEEEDEDEFYLNGVTFESTNRKFHFTYDNDGEPCVDCCDMEGNIIVTLYPKNYQEFISQVRV